MNFRKLSKFFILLLLAGAVLTIVLASNNAAQADESANASKRYASVRIEPGESLWSIASSYADGHYSSIQDYIEELKYINNLDTDTIYAFEYLLVPYYEG